MHHCCLSTFFLAALAATYIVSTATADELSDLRDATEARVYRDAQGHSLLYRLHIPANYDAKKTCPLILFLHGAGERGDDNESQFAHPDVLRLVSAKVAARHPAFLVAPQCPKDEKWVDVDWKLKAPHTTPEKPSESMWLALELVDALQKEFRIDQDRLYITGLSMGGYGTYDALVRRPGQWAAAVAICGGADDSRAGDFTHVPLWIFHGSKDEAVPVARSRSIVAALKKAGGNPKYTEYEGGDHHIWRQAYAEPELSEWLFGQ